MELNGRWFPQIVDRESGNLYPILHRSLVLMGGGGSKIKKISFHVFYTFYAISNIFRKKEVYLISCFFVRFYAISNLVFKKHSTMSAENIFLY